MGQETVREKVSIQNCQVTETRRDDQLDYVRKNPTSWFHNSTALAISLCPVLDRTDLPYRDHNKAVRWDYRTNREIDCDFQSGRYIQKCRPNWIDKCTRYTDILTWYMFTVYECTVGLPLDKLRRFLDVYICNRQFEFDGSNDHRNDGMTMWSPFRSYVSAYFPNKTGEPSAMWTNQQSDFLHTISNSTTDPYDNLWNFKTNLWRENKLPLKSNPQTTWQAF